MNTLLNHTELAINIKDNNLKNAKSLYIKKIRTLLHLTHNPK